MSDEINATSAAQAHAEELGVDLSQVQGSGQDGTITKADVVAAVSTPPTPDSYYYCLNEGHPGVPNFNSEPVNVGRIFGWVGDGVPVCPACGTQGNAIIADGPDMPPQSVLELAARLSN